MCTSLIVHCEGIAFYLMRNSFEDFFYKKSNNIAVVQRSFLSALSVILTERSVGRIPRSDLARDICEMFHFVQHDKLCLGQLLYY